MDQLKSLELINNGWFVVSVCLVCAFGGFLLSEMKGDGWYAKIRNQAALALIVYFTGEALVRAWGGILFYAIQHGNNLSGAFAVQYPLVVTGAAIAFIGAICCVRVFSRPSWGHSGWIGVIVLAVVVMIATYVY